MSLRQSDVVIGTALVVYIVFFSMSPPTVVRTVLSHPVGVAASFGAAIYMTLYYSKPVGVLLIVALLASMTRVTENLTNAEEIQQLNNTIRELEAMGLTPERNDALKNALARRAQLQRQSSPQSELEELNKTIRELEAMGLKPETNDALKNALARRAQLQGQTSPPMTTPRAPAPTSPGPANPPTTPSPATPPPKPVMACNIENFAAF